MPITVTAVRDPLMPSGEVALYSVQGDNAYTANGYVLSPASFGRKYLAAVIPVQQGTANRLVTWDAGSDGAGKLRIWTAINTEAAGASDQSTITALCLVFGPKA